MTATEQQNDDNTPTTRVAPNVTYTEGIYPGGIRFATTTVTE